MPSSEFRTHRCRPDSLSSSAGVPGRELCHRHPAIVVTEVVDGVLVLVDVVIVIVFVVVIAVDSIVSYNHHVPFRVITFLDILHLSIRAGSRGSGDHICM